MKQTRASLTHYLSSLPVFIINSPSLNRRFLYKDSYTVVSFMISLIYFVLRVLFDILYTSHYAFIPYLLLLYSRSFLISLCQWTFIHLFIHCLLLFHIYRYAESLSYFFVLPPFLPFSLCLLSFSLLLSSTHAHFSSSPSFFIPLSSLFISLKSAVFVYLSSSSFSLSLPSFCLHNANQCVCVCVETTASVL